jgi:hypothetical protein
MRLSQERRTVLGWPVEVSAKTHECSHSSLDKHAHVRVHAVHVKNGTPRREEHIEKDGVELVLSLLAAIVPAVGSRTYERKCEAEMQRMVTVLINDSSVRKACACRT